MLAGKGLAAEDPAVAAPTDASVNAPTMESSAAPLRTEAYAWSSGERPSSRASVSTAQAAMKSATPPPSSHQSFAVRSLAADLSTLKSVPSSSPALRSRRGTASTAGPWSR